MPAAISKSSNFPLVMVHLEQTEMLKYGKEIGGLLAWRNQQVANQALPFLVMVTSNEARQWVSKNWPNAAVSMLVAPLISQDVFDIIDMVMRMQWPDASRYAMVKEPTTIPM